MPTTIRYIRVERIHTDSWMTYKLPHPFGPCDNLDEWVEQYLPGWEWVTASEHNPDVIEPDVLNGEQQ